MRINNILNGSRGNAGIKFILGVAFAGLLTGIAYSFVTQSGFFSKESKVTAVEKTTNKEAVHSIEAETQVVPEPRQPRQNLTAPPTPSPNKIISAKPAEPEVDITKPAKIWQEYDENDTNEDYESIIDELNEMKAEEVEYLKEALPNNLLVPFERTQEEIEELIAYSQDLNELREMIDDNTATDEDRQDYLDIVNKQFDDEIELINYCRKMMADPTREITLELCRGISKDSGQRIQEIESMKEKLRKEIMQ